eukprot:TRINITY_DN7450_c0_g1_i1.p1 TRINITY_DN7450_c0_g1~~TRINITY_DN7450_c0_g1_i1.p1  ORF type:complete len:523 (-),score=73.41 TRINITY_DN7450_c0_g1_i1:17-1585(-)
MKRPLILPVDTHNKHRAVDIFDFLSSLPYDQQLLVEERLHSLICTHQANVLSTVPDELWQYTFAFLTWTSLDALLPLACVSKKWNVLVDDLLVTRFSRRAGETPKMTMKFMKLDPTKAIRIKEWEDEDIKRVIEKANTMPNLQRFECMLPPTNFDNYGHVTELATIYAWMALEFIAPNVEKLYLQFYIEGEIGFQVSNLALKNEKLKVLSAPGLPSEIDTILPNLEVLILDNYAYRFRKPMGALLPKLTTLSIENHVLVTDQDILGLTNLTALNMRNNPSVTVTRCKKLRAVNIADSDTMLQQLQELPDLQTLVCTPSPSEIGELTKLTNLTVLDLVGTSLQPDMAHHFTNLRVLHSEPCAGDNSWLSELTNLNFLALAINEYSSSDFSFLSRMTNLRCLWLINEKEPSPSPLPHLPFVDTLHLSGFSQEMVSSSLVVNTHFTAVSIVANNKRQLISEKFANFENLELLNVQIRDHPHESNFGPIKAEICDEGDWICKVLQKYVEFGWLLEFDEGVKLRWRF